MLPSNEWDHLEQTRCCWLLEGCGIRSADWCKAICSAPWILRSDQALQRANADEGIFRSQVAGQAPILCIVATKQTWITATRDYPSVSFTSSSKHICSVMAGTWREVSPRGWFPLLWMEACFPHPIPIFLASHWILGFIFVKRVSCSQKSPFSKFPSLGKR